MRCRARNAIDVAALLGLAWLWIAIYESFTHSGLWLVIDDAFGAVRTMAAQAAVLGGCILVGWVVIAAAAALCTWGLERLECGLPAARVCRRARS